MQDWLDNGGFFLLLLQFILWDSWHYTRGSYPCQQSNIIRGSVHVAAAAGEDEIQ